MKAALAEQAHPRPASPPARRTAFARLLGRGLETHISLPLFALVLIAALWFATFHVIGTEERAARGAAHDATRELVDTYEAQMARSLSGIDQTLRVMQYAVVMNGPNEALGAMSAKGLLPPGLVFQVAITNDAGRILASNPRTSSGGDVSRASWFTFHRDRDGDAPYVSETIGRDEPHVVFSRRINDADGRFAGVATVAVDPAFFTSSYEHSRQGERGLLGMAGGDGVVRAVRTGEQVRWGQRIVIGKADQVVLAPSPLDGESRYRSVRPLNGFPLVAMVGLSESEQMAAFHQQRRAWLLGASAGSALLAIVVSLISAWSWQLAKARRRERLAQETYAAASEASLDAFFVLRTVMGAGGEVADFIIETTNTRAEQLTALSKADMEGKPMSVMLPTYLGSGIFGELAAVAIDGVAREAEWMAHLPHNPDCWLHRQVVRVEGGVVAIVRDITERKRAEQRIRHLAHHDDLTGLPNRSLLRDRLGQAIRDAERKRTSVGLAFIDLDGFKLVNDGLGHNAGDELLKVVGERMGLCLRRNDTLARFGGDEFVILLPDLSGDPMAITPLLEKVRQAVTEPVEVEGQEVQVSCSMGVVLYPRDGLDANTLMMNADAAMYRAKENKNSFQFYASEMNASVEEKLVLLEGMRTALEPCLEERDGRCTGADCQFQLLYQPKVDLRTGQVFGVEALIRWNHPEHGLISPLRFIGLAEESGMIVPLGEWVLRTACFQTQAWRDAGLPPLAVSVNVSARQFEEKRLVERIADALRDSGLPPQALEVEVTESSIMRDLARSVEKMRELEAMGVALSIDDFGTGYSSLSALKSFPISRLKIDKSFVSDLADSLDDQAIAMAVISLGHKLNLRVIAEGVETEQQRDFLRANDCDEMQGYLFSRPVPPERIAEMLAASITLPESP
ncbi:bifunctional diguanylate cyclase/phosphodiesterase [Telluria aromaticivorans]|uniref:EAL domain-containing protein n=1 Tax=Telluria aromaticivorans TaxID=2725995 RepID=A0A7Y2NZX3_9BURK|nr:EAL domain-containing protein [Telluria aromaticivorans]NNG23578.1 EAL domain-containing protein [Telluria aromaticivorans]